MPLRGSLTSRPWGPHSVKSLDTQAALSWRTACLPGSHQTQPVTPRQRETVPDPRPQGGKLPRPQRSGLEEQDTARRGVCLLDQPPWQEPGSRPSLALSEPAAPVLGCEHLGQRGGERGLKTAVRRISALGGRQFCRQARCPLQAPSQQRPGRTWRPAPHPGRVLPTLVPVEQRPCGQKTCLCGCDSQGPCPSPRPSQETLPGLQPRAHGSCGHVAPRRSRCAQDPSAHGARAPSAGACVQ